MKIRRKTKTALTPELRRKALQEIGALGDRVGASRPSLLSTLTADAMLKNRAAVRKLLDSVTK